MTERSARQSIGFVESGVGIYNSATVSGIEATPEARALIDQAMEAHYQHVLRHETKEENHSVIKPCDIKRHEVRLESGETPHDLIMELAKVITARDEYGFPMAVSVDFAKAAASSRATDVAESHLRAYGHEPNHVGFAIFIEQSDDENPYHMERINRIKTVVGELAIPSMVVYTEHLPDDAPGETGPEPGASSIELGD